MVVGTCSASVESSLLVSYRQLRVVAPSSTLKGCEYLGETSTANGPTAFAGVFDEGVPDTPLASAIPWNTLILMIKMDELWSNSFTCFEVWESGALVLTET